MSRTRAGLQSLEGEGVETGFKEGRHVWCLVECGTWSRNKWSSDALWFSKMVIIWPRNNACGMRAWERNMDRIRELKKSP